MYYVLRVAGAANLMMADFNLVVSTPTAKLPNFPAIQYRVYNGEASSPLSPVSTYSLPSQILSSIFAHWKPSNTKGNKDLGTRYQTTYIFTVNVLV